MKKNNIIVLATLVVVCALLLWLWFYLGFNQIDNPLDLVLAIAWWAVIAAIVIFVTYLERKRQHRIRTIYVSPTALYNSERGIVALDGTAIDTMQDILQKLQYGFDTKALPDKKHFDYRYIVQTDEYKEHPGSSEAKNAAGEPMWTGKVIKLDRQNGNAEVAFQDVHQLQEALA